MSHSTGIARLRADQLDRARDVLARAFQDDPMFTYMVPDPAKRAKAVRALLGAVVKYALGYGEVYTTPDVAGVAVWLPPGKTMRDGWRHIRTGLAIVRAMFSFPSDGRKRAMDADDYVEKAHKRLVGGPHWYLSLLGVDPARQREGIGSALLRPALEQADAASLPCYLETQSERNVAFYTKHGFEIADTIRFPGCDVTTWAMLRRTRSS